MSKVFVTKYYVVWKGRTPGIYETWSECFEQVNSFSGASYKSFKTKEEAQNAYSNTKPSTAKPSITKPSITKPSITKPSESSKPSIAKPSITKLSITKPSESSKPSIAKPSTANNVQSQISIGSISVDAACSGNPGPMEYRGVWTDTPEEEIFKFGPIEGTNNIGEFLALVEGLKFLKEYDLDICIYSDSLTAITWVKNKRANTTLKENDKTKQAFKLLREAEKWLEINKYTTKILKWDTKTLGEIKADFGRK